MSSFSPAQISLPGRDFIPPRHLWGQGHVTRFAPSPTGYLHLGHAYSAWFAWMAARQTEGRFVLRIEDIDRTRCRQSYAEAIMEDLAWLGLTWDGPVVYQSRRQYDYDRALERLNRLGLTYPCFCTRSDIATELGQMAQAPHGFDGDAVYPGRCRRMSESDAQRKLDDGIPFAIRLDVQRAREFLRGRVPIWKESRQGEIEARPERLGDVILARKDIATSYHLAVTVDDSAQGVTLVTRGEDLYQSTHIHRMLQAILDLPSPIYYHHNTVVDKEGQRLAKRRKAPSIRHMRQIGYKPEDVWRSFDFKGDMPVSLV